MAATKLGDTILEREFESVDADGNQSIITFRLGIPYKSQDAKGIAQWRCAYQITGIGLETVHFAMGIDAIDALTTCLQLGDIFIRSYRNQRTITWLEQPDLHLVPCPVEELTEEKRNAMREEENNPFKQIFDEFFSKGNLKPPVDDSGAADDY